MPGLAVRHHRASPAQHRQRPDGPAHGDRVSLCDVQIAARHADPRTTMRYDGLDRHPNYILVAYMASGT